MKENSESGREFPTLVGISAKRCESDFVWNQRLPFVSCDSGSVQQSCPSWHHFRVKTLCEDTEDAVVQQNSCEYFSES